ncbi:hypothetical protein EV644_110164 [Kribbella orskensis]|uniref:Uncharacterized protein n=1 Tax=Kribbella orskensis TaxID=2512216 RepID=A0ABY2BGR9_9ACTN|nr:MULTISPECIES: DUF6177 family protein [Kribbella]TCN38029.1 hypothetical protein EV642_110186 [Kribbella sp. VKM Ac-2500]TCO19516.1 hypothetical protein EV644_110164 [Kribbella orskensis]
MPNPVELSPGIDVRTEKVVVIMQDRPVVGMSAWLVDALAAAESEGLGVQLVTPSTTRLTFAVRTTLFSGRESRWVVTEPGGEGAYDGQGGSRLKWDGQMFAAVAAGEQDKVDMSPTFVAVDLELPFQLLITARVRYQALESTVVGKAAELLFKELTGDEPAGWGTAEPVTQPWNVGQLTAYCRRRAPKPTWLAVVGGKDGRSATGAVEIHRRPAGLEEVITVAVATPEGLPSPGEVQAVAEKLADSFSLVSFFAQGARGGTDTNAMPHWTGVPAPMGMAVGNDALQGDGLAKAMDMTGVAEIVPVKIGPAASPAVWYPIGDGKSQLDWNIYSALLGRLVPPGAPRS